MHIYITSSRKETRYNSTLLYQYTIPEMLKATHFSNFILLLIKMCVFLHSQGILSVEIKEKEGILMFLEKYRYEIYGDFFTAAAGYAAPLCL